MGAMSDDSGFVISSRHGHLHVEKKNGMFIEVFGYDFYRFNFKI